MVDTALGVVSTALVAVQLAGTILFAVRLFQSRAQRSADGQKLASKRLLQLGLLAVVAMTGLGVAGSLQHVSGASVADRATFIAAGISETMNAACFGGVVALPALLLGAFGKWRVRT